LDFGAEQESGLQIWRAVSMTHSDGPALAQALIADKAVDRVVLDSGDGGTGTSFDWSTVPTEVLSSALLAGGIGLDNVEGALRVGTVGLDINSGVETVKGVKDTGLIARVFATIRKFHA
jgi:indole-3-glycerol phosphate synthase/phosphoribosylanthranilate isomerase